MADFASPDRLRQHRPLFLAMEAVGWLHMAGKARAEFLREHGGQKTDYDDRRWHERENPPFPWNDLLQWVRDQFKTVDENAICWPSTLTDFLTKHRGQDAGMLGLLQAAHGMASGVEKNLPGDTSKYLGQDITHTWLSSAFGQPARNLLADPPEVLTDSGWRRLLGEVRRILEDLRTLGTSNARDVGAWQRWRDSAIGPNSFLRAAFSSTIAETRLPNNEVTLWDQSYVAAALFKSAVAGAVLEGRDFPWASKDLKQTTRWRLLTVGMGTDHYEARAIRIGDWIGARADIDAFFDQVCQLVEVDRAVGSLLYRDASVCVFSFPGERSDGTSADLRIGEWEQWLARKVDKFAKELKLETPPYCRISEPTRSLVPMVKERREAREVLAVPVHRAWQISDKGEEPAKNGHVCPVCLVRYNGRAHDKQRPCEACQGRRRGRLDAWLNGKLGSDTIWIDEVADANGRVALLTLSLDLERWLDGQRVDSLRAQAISQWFTNNKSVARAIENQTKAFANRPVEHRLVQYFKKRIESPSKSLATDGILRKVLPGFEEEFEGSSDASTSWRSLFELLVKDRAPKVQWSSDSLDNARWLVFQAFRKLASPGRIYRFWRQAEEFFTGLLCEFREIAARDTNRWRVRRLIVVPDQTSAGEGWQDREIYDGRLGDAPVSLLYRQESQDFVTACNLARLLRAEETATALAGEEIPLQGDDRKPRTLRVKDVKDAGPLGAYHPAIPLELSPLRFRVLVPLEAASACLDRAVAAWNEQFARVWDRLPLRAGIIAFPRTLPFQAVIEATRNVEDALDKSSGETWRVTARDVRSGVVALTLKRPDDGTELRTIPVTLPDGRTDVFYSYLAVDDRAVRFPCDFQHPHGQVYRHALDLRPGDGIRVEPARVATVFLDSTGSRFEPVTVRPLADWSRMRDIWRLIERMAPSLTALHGAWAELVERRESWQRPVGDDWFPGGREARRDLARAVLADRLEVRGAALDALADAADDDTLDWALDWHLSVLKEGTGEVTHA